MTDRPRLTVCLFFLIPWALQGQTLAVSPNRVMVDQTATIRAAGLRPDERVTIHAELVDGDGVRWTAQADFVADGDGTVDSSRQPAVAGSYKDVSAMGLVWSMRPSSRKSTRYQPPRNFDMQPIEFRFMRGRTHLGGATLEQISLAAGVKRVTLHDGALRGTLFLPPGNSPHPGVLVLGGSEGGLPARRGAWLASHGFAALALAYFRYEDLPSQLAAIPLEYFGQALNWMAHRPEIRPDHIAVMGVSRGAELALQLGSMFPGIGAVVAYSPANVRYPACCGFTPVPYAWTWGGQGLAFRPVRPRMVLEGMAMRAVIEVERTKGPILLITGKDDHVWDSALMADSIVSRLKEHQFAYPVEHLNYPHAGHAAGRPELIPAWQEGTRNPSSGRDVEMGGTPQGNAESSLEAIGKVIDFLKQSFSAH